MNGPASRTVTTAIKDLRLATLDQVKEELNLAGSDEDARLGRILDRVSRRLAGDSFLGSPPWRQTYTITLPGTDRQRLYPGVHPIETVTSVKRGGATIDADIYSVGGELREYLFRDTGWSRDAALAHGDATGERRHDSATPEYEVVCVAGWIPPGIISDWSDAAVKTVGDWARSTDTTVQLRFECTTAGTTDANEPTWPTVVGDTVTDNDVVWTARAALELPEDITEAALALAVDSYYRRGSNPQVASMKEADRSVTFRAAGDRKALAREVAMDILPYRVAA